MNISKHRLNTSKLSGAQSIATVENIAAVKKHWLRSVEARCAHAVDQRLQCRVVEKREEFSSGVRVQSRPRMRAYVANRGANPFQLASHRNPA